MEPACSCPRTPRRSGRTTGTGGLAFPAPGAALARSRAARLAGPIAVLTLVLGGLLSAIPACRTTPGEAVHVTPPVSSVGGPGAEDDAGKIPERVWKPEPAGEAPEAEDEDSTIQGRVLDAGGSPLAGASIVLFEGHMLEIGILRTLEAPSDPRSCRVVASATSGKDGRFRVSGLQHARYTVRVTLPGFRAVETQAEPEDDAMVEVRLVPFAAIEGRVLGAQGQPIAHGTVSLYPDPEGSGEVRPYPDPEGYPGLFHLWAWTWCRPPISRAETDSAGRFRLAVGAERNALVAAAPGHAPALLRGVGEGVPGAPEPVLRLAPGLSLAGQAADEGGRGLEGAGLILWKDSPTARLPDPEAVTDATGEFAFDGLEDREYRLLVGHPEHAWTRLAVRPGGSAVETTRVVLERGEAVEGRVIDAVSLSPIEGARVTMEVAGFPENSCIADPVGMYRIAGFERSARRGLALRAEADGYRSEQRGIRNPWEGSFDTNLALEPLASARGLVTDLKGIPVPRAKVRCSSYPTRPARTNARGEFLLEGLLPGLEIRLQVRHPSFLPERVELLALRPGQLIDLGTLRLSRGGRARGRVVAADGRPLEGVLVGASPTGLAWKPEFPALCSVTDAAGEFAVARIPPGSHDLTAWHESAIEASIQGIEIQGEDRVEAIVFQLRTGRELRGQVLSDGGEPVSGAVVRVYDFGNGFRLLESRTDAKGRFSVPGIAAQGRVELRAEHPEHGTFASQDIPLGSGDVMIRLAMGVR